jgi:hypothetical protein
VRERIPAPEIDQLPVGLVSDPTLDDQDNQINGQSAPGNENLLTVDRIGFATTINRTNGAWPAAKSSPTL